MYRSEEGYEPFIQTYENGTITVTMDGESVVCADWSEVGHCIKTLRAEKKASLRSGFAGALAQIKQEQIG